MSKKHILLIALLVALMTLVSFTAAYAADPKGLASMPDPVDPQSWEMSRDRTWDDFVPNPVIDWRKEINPAGYYNPRNSGNRVSTVKGALVLFEYLDRPFISSQPVGSDVLGYYMYKEDGTGVDYDGGIKKNPLVSQPRTLAEKDYSNTPGTPNFQKDPVFANWWKDFLIAQHANNHGVSQQEYFMETSYGKWDLEFDAFGPFEVNCFEFEIRDSYQGTTELPPSFRSPSTGAPTAANPGNLRSSGSIDSFAFAIMQEKLDPASGPAQRYFRNNFDFFHILHSGYDESGVWHPFGMGQYAKRSDLPDELTPIGRMHKVEEVFTARPELLAIYADRYRGTSAPGRAFWAAELAKYNALVADGKGDEYVFKLSQDDWDWANNWKNTTTRNTRYVAWTSWESGVGEWSHMNTTTSFGTSMTYSTQGECDAMATFAHEFGHIAGLPDNYGNPYTIRTSPLTEAWEIMSRGSFAGPFGDLARWTVPGVEGGTVPVHAMVRQKVVAGYYDSADLLTFTTAQLAAGTPRVAEIVPRNIPLNNNKTTARPNGLYPWLEDDYGLVSPNYYKGIRLNFASPYADQANSTANRKTTGFTWNWSATAATAMSVEVVQRTGYDSFAPDDGVLLSRILNFTNGTNNGNSFNVVDSHLYDIGMIDYVVKDGINTGTAAAPNYIDDYASYTLGHQAQQYDAAFHAGKSFVDTGYYGAVYEDNKYYQQTANNSGLYNTVTAPSTANYAEYGVRYFNSESSGMTWQKAMSKIGSIQRWEPQDGRPVVSGDTVNEWVDPFNKLHFYILAKNTHDGKYGEFISYQVGVLHENGVAVGGELTMVVDDYEEADPGRVAIYWIAITNTGDATDIIRVGVDCNWEYTLLNDLYAIGAGETIKVPVYVGVPTDNTTLALTVNASSESNSGKKASVFCGPILEIANILVAPGGIANVTYSIKGNVFGFTTFDFDIPYDGSIYKPIALNSITKGALLVSSLDGIFAANPVYGGKDVIKASFASRTKVDGDGVLFTVSYELDAAVKVLDIPLNATVIKASLSLVGDEFYDLNLQVKPGMLVVGIMGDINGDGFVTPEDAIELLQMYVGLIPWTTRALLVGDLNGDGELDPIDAALILRMVVGG
ncbi:MAG: immune inhibitor A [Clostridiales bacterium]|jgi:M6 family metalloprotease-like protein|nr:immune inhibitor A [Clostridiales bacterium]